MNTFNTAIASMRQTAPATLVDNFEAVHRTAIETAYLAKVVGAPGAPTTYDEDPLLDGARALCQRAFDALRPFVAFNLLDAADVAGYSLALNSYEDGAMANKIAI